jgi:toxin ParE1/3/4
MFLVVSSGSAALGQRFLAAAERTFADLSRMPELGGRKQFAEAEIGEVRIWSVHGFRSHLVFYRDRGTAVEIVRVLHAARDWEILFEPRPSEPAP